MELIRRGERRQQLGLGSRLHGAAVSHCLTFLCGFLFFLQIDLVELVLGVVVKEWLDDVELSLRARRRIPTLWQLQVTEFVFRLR